MGGNYEKNLFKQLEMALLKIDELSDKVKKIETETENKYLKIIYELEAKNAFLHEENAVLREKVAKCEAEIDRLRKQINNNSSNSSTPPSFDVKPNRPNTYNSRTKTSKPSGGQEKHKGYHFSKAQIEEKIKSGEVVHNIVNHSTNDVFGDFISKYEVDIKVETIVTEHRFYRNESGKIVIPKEYSTDVQYANEIKTLVSTLIGQGIVASNRVVDLLSEMTGNIVNLSDGTVYNFLAEFDAKATETIETIRTKLLNEPVMHVDETGSRCEKKNMFFRNYSNENYVLYTFNPTKGIKAITDDGILPVYIGKLVHDHNTANYNYGTNNGECNVHLLRYLKANTENTNNVWSEEMSKFLLTINQTKKLAQAYGLEKFENEKLIEYSEAYDEIIVEGYKSLENTGSRFYKKQEKALLNRLKKYKDNHLLFAFDFAVPFDNNLSERDLRVVKTKTKVSGCFRSLAGGKRYANLMSVIKTAIKQKISPYKSINSIFKNAIAYI